MKWDKKNKEVIYQLLWDKSHLWKGLLLEVDYSMPPGVRTRVAYENLIAWNDFLDSLDIDRVFRGSTETGRYRLGQWWVCDSYNTWPLREYYKPNREKIATSKKHIIVLDPFVERFDMGLRIPKSVAEKFLVLGVP